MRRYLATYSANWADEMDLAGVYVMSEEEYKRVMEYDKEKHRGDRSYSWYCGSNQEMEYEEFDDFYNSLCIEEISELEYQVLSKLNLTNLGLAEKIMDRIIDWIND